MKFRKDLGSAAHAARLGIRWGPADGAVLRSHGSNDRGVDGNRARHQLPPHSKSTAFGDFRTRDLAPRRGRAASRGGIQHASDAFTMVAREIVCVRPAAVALVEHRAPDVVGILRTSARTHPCSADVDEGNLRSLRHSVVRRHTQDVTRARIGLLAQL